MPTTGLPTSPFLADSPALLPYTLGQAVVATATFPGTSRPDLPLDVQSGSSISFDGKRAPRAMASLVCRVPEDQATLDALDPRTAVRVKVSAGYLRPDGPDVQPVVDLALRARRVARPGNLMTLEASGAEAAVIDAGGPPVRTTYAGATVPAAIPALLNAAANPATIALTVLPGVIALAPPVTPVPVDASSTWWAVADDLADQAFADLWEDGLGTWYLGPAMTSSALGEPVHELRVGVSGTVLAADTGLSRDGWANAVVLLYHWQTVDSAGATVDRYEFGRANATGAMAPNVAGRTLYRETREAWNTADGANKAAEATLRRRLAGGRSMRLSAIAAWWLRPGHTVAVSLPTGERELLLVQDVTFDAAAGRMDLTVARPDSTTTITQGA